MPFQKDPFLTEVACMGAWIANRDFRISFFLLFRDSLGIGSICPSSLRKRFLLILLGLASGLACVRMLGPNPFYLPS